MRSEREEQDGTLRNVIMRPGRRDEGGGGGKVADKDVSSSADDKYGNGCMQYKCSYLCTMDARQQNSRQ